MFITIITIITKQLSHICLFFLFQIILPHFLNAIKPHIEDHWCDDLENAWKTMFDIIIYYMKEGYKEPKHCHKEYIVEETT
jgi:hypothetical protein